MKNRVCEAWKESNLDEWTKWHILYFISLTIIFLKFFFMARKIIMGFLKMKSNMMLDFLNNIMWFYFRLYSDSSAIHITLLLLFTKQGWHSENTWVRICNTHFLRIRREKKRKGVLSLDAMFIFSFKTDHAIKIGEYRASFSDLKRT